VAEDDARREQAANQMGFSAYGVTATDDPMAQAMRGLIDNASGHEHQIALLWQALETLQAQANVTGGNPNPNCLPDEAARQETFAAKKFTDLVGK